MVNQVSLIGRLTADPEVYKLPSGNAVTNFGLATNRRWKDAKSGETKDNAQFHHLKAWGRIGEVVSEYLKKGDLAHIIGRIEYQEGKDKEGKKRFFTNIIVRELNMLGGKSMQKSAEARAKKAETEAADEEVTVIEEAPFK